MRTYYALLILLLSSAPALAQPRVWTNDDLRKPLSAEPAPVSVATLAGLVARQYHAPQERPDAPLFVVIGSEDAAAGPWQFPPPIPPKRLDGTPLWLPPTVYGERFRLASRFQTLARPRRAR